MKKSIERWLSTLFGLLFVALACFVAVETVLRKGFNVSLQGADELAGYTLAIGATIAFSLALMGRSHIRIDLFHRQIPRSLQTLLNWLSAMCLATLATLLAYLAWFVARDSLGYQSVSQTPWATPLVYPQSAWLFGLATFALVSVGYAVYATVLMLRGKSSELGRKFGPRSSQEEISEELEDLKKRISVAPDSVSPATE